MNKTLRTVAGISAICGALAFAGTAEANFYLDYGGLTPAQGPAPAGATKKNDVFPYVYGSTNTSPPQTWEGYYLGFQSGFADFGSGFITGALKVDTKSVIDFAYLGSEAGFKNSFEINTTGLPSGWVSIKTIPQTVDPKVNIAGPGDIAVPTGATVANVAPETVGTLYAPFIVDANQVVQFRFKIKDGDGFATNGGAQSGYYSNSSIFLTFLDSSGQPKDKAGQLMNSGNVVDVALDDSGASIDDNHDDMVMRLTATPVPVPAALPIIGAALAGFGFAGWRSKRRTA